MAQTSSPRRLRWWPAALIVALLAAALIYIWNIAQLPSDQHRVMNTALSIVVSSILLLLWWVFFSGLRAWTRLRGLLVVVGLYLLCWGLFRYDGVSGNLVPQLTWRWSERDLVSERASDAISDFTVGTYDFPQFLGPDRDGRLPARGLLADWEAHPPRLLWKQDIGAGWAGFAIVDGVAVTLEQRQDQETVVAYDLDTGKVFWTHGDPVSFENPVAGAGPRSTPTLHEGRVYTLGATGLLNCLNFESGELLWQRDIEDLFDKASSQQYGRAASPLIVDDLVVVNPGGEGSALAAFDKVTGQLRWSKGTATPAYASPVLATLAGQRQILNYNYATLAGHDPRDGSVLWQTELEGRSPRCAQPLVVSENLVLTSAGYGLGSEMFQVRREESGKWQVERAYRTIRLKSKFADMIYFDDFIYGLDDGILTCIDPGDGSRRWKGGRYGHGQLLLVGDLLLITTEGGDVVLIDPKPSRLIELARFQALDGAKVWNPPALAGNILLVRDHRQAAAFELPMSEELAEEEQPGGN
ncbi:MAG TPA: PQQ-binding-like beta-propeller repeat protein [Acidobacteriota bacterium]|nr:PQQ-binding-like beta-propeller repeat protein [Acidobacteriota bacterium]